jgi:DNA-binding CsgD family transcriptional regulator
MRLSDAKIVELYSEGKSCADIAKINNCSETFIYNKLKKLDTKIRGKSEANQVLPDFIFIILYNMGLSASQTGRLLGVNSSTVVKRLHTLNFPLRSRCVASRIRYTEKEFNRHFMVSEVLDKLMSLV